MEAAGDEGNRMGRTAWRVQVTVLVIDRLKALAADALPRGVWQFLATSALEHCEI